MRSREIVVLICVLSVVFVLATGFSLIFLTNAISSTFIHDWGIHGTHTHQKTQTKHTTKCRTRTTHIENKIVFSLSSSFLWPLFAHKFDIFFSCGRAVSAKQMLNIYSGRRRKKVQNSNKGHLQFHQCDAFHFIFAPVSFYNITVPFLCFRGCTWTPMDDDKNKSGKKTFYSQPDSMTYLHFMHTRINDFVFLLLSLYSFLQFIFFTTNWVSLLGQYQVLSTGKCHTEWRIPFIEFEMERESRVDGTRSEAIIEFSFSFISTDHERSVGLLWILVEWMELEGSLNIFD